MASQPNTPRRSKRYQPLVEFSTNRGDSAAGTVSWLGASIHIRATRGTDLHEEDEIDSLDDAETEFYSGFSRITSTQSSAKKRKTITSEGNVFRVGDTVLVKSQAKHPSVAVIVALWDVKTKDGEVDGLLPQKVKVHWFLRGSELPSVRAKKEKHAQNEVFFSLSSTAILTPQYIIQHCRVSSDKSAIENVADAARSSSSSSTFYCHLAIDARRGLHYKFDWEKHRDHACKVKEDFEGDSWVVTPKEGNKKAKYVRMKISAERSDDRDGSEEDYDREGDDDDDESESSELSITESEPEPSSDDDDDDHEQPCTPSRKRKATTGASQMTPRRPRRTRQTIAAPTPHSKAALRARAKRAKRKTIASPPDLVFDIRPLELEELPTDPWLRAMRVLHVGSRPDVLPCREDEFSRILRSVDALLEEGSGGCIYISGVPGTGKTATVHRIVRELKRMAEQNEANPFTYVEINGLKIPDPAAAYCLLWEAVSGHDVAAEGHLKISSKEALKQLTKHFSAGVRAGPGRHACVVLMDELDQLVTTKQDVVYNFFNWPTLVGSKLIVIAVANTMDLPERAMTGRVRSRLGMVRINFQPYTTPQLEKIVQARLASANATQASTTESPAVIAPDGIKFAAMKVSSISGDARRVLDICRRAVEHVQVERRAARTNDVKDVIKAMQSSPTAAWLRGCSLHERIMLAALVKCVKREGVEEIKWGEVQHQHILYTNILTGEGDSTRRPSVVELRQVLASLLASHAVLIEDGAGVSRKPEGEKRMLLNIEQSEVERVLGDIGGQRWKNALGV